MSDDKMDQRVLADIKLAIPALERMRANVCGYLGSSCDCKFGFDQKEYSEQTGCPELRVAIGVLKDYERLSLRNAELERTINTEVRRRVREKIELILNDI